MSRVIPIAALLCAYACVYLLTGFSVPCVFRLVTGLRCPGCGSHGAFRAAMRLDIDAVFRLNLLFPLEILYFVYAAVYISVTYLKTGKADKDLKPAWLNISVLAVVILWWIARNILDI